MQAELLLELGVDGYCKNGAGRSALSMGIETLPALAVRLPERPAETGRDSPRPAETGRERAHSACDRGLSLASP